MGSVAARVAMYQTVGKCLVLTVNSSVKRGYLGGGGGSILRERRRKEENISYFIYVFKRTYSITLSTELLGRVPHQR